MPNFPNMLNVILTGISDVSPANENVINDHKKLADYVPQLYTELHTVTRQSYDFRELKR